MAGLPIAHNLEMPTILPVREYTAFTKDLLANRKISSKNRRVVQPATHAPALKEYVRNAHMCYSQKACFR